MFAQSIRRRSCAVGLALTLVGATFGSAAYADEPTPDPGPTVAVAPTDPAAAVPDATDDAATDGAATGDVARDDLVAAAPAPEQQPVDPQAAGTVASVALSVASDGTANVDGGWDPDDGPGNDSGPTNGVVRTQDTVLYQWSYTVATAGDVTFVQTLPAQMVWRTAESTASCVEGAAAVSTDGRTLTCTLAGQSVGGHQYRPLARVRTGANGQQLDSTLTTGGRSSSASVRISARPTISIVTQGDASFGAQTNNGVVGRYVRFRAGFYSPVDSNRGVKGAEAVGSDAFTLTLDVSDMGPDVALLGSCTTTLGIFGVTVNSTAGAGTWGCTLDAAAGTLTLHATGVVSDLSTYPPNSTRAYITGVDLQLWMPSTDYTPGDAIDLQLAGFDPVSVSGQPNWGGSLATPGQEPGADLVPHLNGETLVPPTDEAIQYGLWSVFAQNADGTFGSTPPGFSPGAGTTPMTSGETYFYGGYLRNSSPSLTDYTDVTVCAVWDQSTLNLAGAPARGTQNAAPGDIVGVEYASLDVSTDAQRRGVDCGASGDGGAAWSTTVAGAGGASQVNAVRFMLPTLSAASGSGSPYIGIPLTRTSAVRPTGTPLAVFWQGASDQTPLQHSKFDPTTQTLSDLGGRTLAAGAVVTIDAVWNASAAVPGDSRTFTAQPTVTSASGKLSHTLTAQDVTLDEIVPRGMTVVPNSWLPAPTPTITARPDGSQLYSFALGDLSDDGPIDPVVLTATVDPDVAVPTTLTTTATVSSPSDPVSRSDSATLGINALAELNATMTVDDAAIVPGIPATYHVRLTNSLPEATGAGTAVVVLPFDDDGRGTHGLGVLDLVGRSVVQGATEVEYTTDDAADTLAATDDDPSGSTGVTWRAWPSDGSAPAGATAVRLAFDSIASGASLQVDLAVRSDTLTYGALLVTTLDGVIATGPSQITLQDVARTELHSGAGRIAGTVYRDADASGALDTGDSGLADVPVAITGYTYGPDGVDDGGSGDDAVVTGADAISVTTGDDGHYLVDGIAPGTWTLTPDVSQIGDLVPAETPGPVAVALAGDLTEVDAGFVVPAVPPVLADDTAETGSGMPVDVDVLANDPTAGLTVTDVDAATTQGGTAEVLPSGPVRYTPTTTGTTLEDTFTYTATDASGGTATATVTVDVYAAPTADPLTLRTEVDQDVSGDAWALVGTGAHPGTTGAITTVTAHGVLDWSQADRTVTYTPEAGYVGTDSAQITWTDPFGQSAVQEVDITVVDAPVVVPPPAGTDPTPQPTAPAAPSTGTDGATGSGVLATTGVEITGLIGLALGLLVVGGLLARRRRREAVPVEVEVED